MTSVNFYKISEKDNFRDIKEAQELTDLVKAQKLVVLDIYANWCQPCRYIGPKFKELSKSHPEAVFATINSESLNPEQVKEFGVTALPTFLYFKSGRYVDKVMGANILDVVDKLMLYKLL